MARATRQLPLAGIFASAITPHKERAPDFSASLDLLDFLANAGVQAICLFGAAGEFLNYTFAERQRLVYLGVKRSRVPLLVGVSHSTLAGAIQLAAEAITSGADGLLLMPPYFFPYGPREIEEFYLQFARETEDVVPILLHNLPQSTSNLDLDLVRKLLDTGRFAGIKDSSGDWSYFEQLLALKKERPFALFNGHDRLAAPALLEGADGIISNSACAVPELLVHLTRAIAARNEPLTSILNSRLNEFIDWSERFPFPVAVKRAVELRGQTAGDPMTPLAPETCHALTEFSTWFRTWFKTWTASVSEKGLRP
jgi:dihydrodipicolinate synthase/N-acetylneuraminate lyase